MMGIYKNGSDIHMLEASAKFTFHVIFLNITLFIEFSCLHLHQWPMTHLMTLSN